MLPLYKSQLPMSYATLHVVPPHCAHLLYIQTFFLPERFHDGPASFAIPLGLKRYVLHLTPTVCLHRP
jgi:hypothetical protein